MVNGGTLELLAYAFGLIGLAGGVVGYFGKARGDSIIKYQANEIQLRDGTIARLKEDNAALSAEREVLLKDNDHFKARNKDLISQSQGSPQLKKLTTAVETLTKTINTRFKEGK